MKSNRRYHVYFMANSTNVALYIGVTNDLKRRVFEHKHKPVKGFTAKYDINKLVETINPQWLDLYDRVWYARIMETDRFGAPIPSGLTRDDGIPDDAFSKHSFT